MKCKKCGLEKNVKNIKPLGTLCYKCFEDIVSLMLDIQAMWAKEEIIPIIKQKIFDSIMNNDDINVDYEKDDILFAIRDMLENDALPEKVRLKLTEYMESVS